MSVRRRGIYLAGLGVLLLLALAGCRVPLDRSSIVIDWVHFIEWNDRSYEHLYSAAVTNPSDVDDQVGQVTHKLDGSVHNPNYRSKNGDAAYLDKGTPFYSVKGLPTDEVLAVADANAINGYQLFAAHDDWPKLNLSYSDLPRDKIKAVDIYWTEYNGTNNSASNVNRLEAAAAEPFLALLDQSFSAESEHGYWAEAPGYYTVVFDIGGPLSYAEQIFNDGSHYYWSPSQTYTLSDNIETYLGPLPASTPSEPPQSSGAR